MPPNIFKNTSTGLWTDVGTKGAIWRFDRYGVTPIYMECTFQTYDESYQVFTGTFEEYVPITGDIVITFENYAGDVQLFTGSHVDTNVTGDLACTFETFGFFSQAGLHLDCAFEKWEYWSVFNIEGEDMDNCIFEPFDCLMIGSSDYVYMDCEFREFEAEFFNSPGLVLATEKWDFNATGTNGVMATLDLTFRRFEFVGKAGGPISMDLEFEHLEFEANALTEFRGSLDLVFKLFQTEMEGNSDIVGHLDLRFKPLVITISSDTFLDPVGNLDCVFQAYQVEMSGIKGLDGELNGSIGIYMDIQMTGYSDGPNSLDLVFEAPDGEFQDDGGEGGADCALADTLTYTR